MSAEVFIDTNVVLYAVSTDRAEDAKARRARDILAHEDFGLSSQVLQEFFVNATRKISIPLSDKEALEFVEIISQGPVVPVDRELVLEAIGYKSRFGISYWDAAIIAASHALDAKVLYTEDLSDGQLYGEVRAINPFAESS
jgi:predicted nucleic acid-binding protein